jgi:hypothetical protein
MPPVTHFVQHICVSWCVSIFACHVSYKITLDSPGGEYSVPISSFRAGSRCDSDWGLLTGLDLRALLLVAKELANLGLVGIVEPLEVEIFDGRLCGAHFFIVTVARLGGLSSREEECKQMTSCQVGQMALKLKFFDD